MNTCQWIKDSQCWLRPKIEISQSLRNAAGNFFSHYSHCHRWSITDRSDENVLLHVLVGCLFARSLIFWSQTTFFSSTYSSWLNKSPSKSSLYELKLRTLQSLLQLSASIICVCIYAQVQYLKHNVTILQQLSVLVLDVLFLSQKYTTIVKYQPEVNWKGKVVNLMIYAL